MYTTTNEIPNKPGIYRITSTINGKFYVGSSTNCRRRMKQHMSRLSLGKHGNKHLQAHFDKYTRKRENIFVFEILSICNKEEALKKEQQIINEWQENWQKTFNIALDVHSPAKGRVFGLEYSILKSEQTTTLWEDPQFRDKMVQIHKERCSTKENKKKFSKKMKKYWANPERKAELSRRAKEKYHNNPDHPFKTQKYDKNRRKKASFAASKLSQVDREKIRELYSKGTFLQKDLAERFNVSLSTISRVIHKKHELFTGE